MSVELAPRDGDLVSPTTALMAWGLFGEPLPALPLPGTALAALGVTIAMRPRSRA